MISNPKIIIFIIDRGLYVVCNLHHVFGNQHCNQDSICSCIMMLFSLFLTDFAVHFEALPFPNLQGFLWLICHFDLFFEVVKNITSAFDDLRDEQNQTEICSQSFYRRTHPKNYWIKLNIRLTYLYFSSKAKIPIFWSKIRN